MHYVPKIAGDDDKALSYLFLRKFDQERDVMTLASIFFNLEASLSAPRYIPDFTVGILSNDVRARAMLNTMLDNPPNFHRRRELRLLEHKWRSDSRALEMFRASLTAAKGWTKATGRVYRLSVKGKDAVKEMAKVKPYLGRWW